MPLMDEESDPDVDDDGIGGGGGRCKKTETPEERWMRERDDWLFGRCCVYFLCTSIIALNCLVYALLLI